LGDKGDAIVKTKKRILSEEILQEIVRRIVAAVQPEKIILFGSAARKEIGLDSDVDLLVVKPCGHRRRTARKIERSLIGIGIPTDIIVAKPDDIERYKDTIGLIYRPALREGKTVYAA
jgi:predicted nucleotidyltransferase